MTKEEAKEALRKERAAIKTCAQHAEWARSDHYRELVETAYKDALFNAEERKSRKSEKKKENGGKTK